MKKAVRITIPKPCHENWDAMQPEDKGRFCASCQKVVVDFTRLSDREIAGIYNKDRNTCGIFLDTQLNRDLYVPARKKPLWLAAGAAVMSFLSLGTGQAFSQVMPSMEQMQAEAGKSDLGTYTGSAKSVSGIVTDENDNPVSGVSVKVKGFGTEVLTDDDGKFSIAANEGDIIRLSSPGFKSRRVTITGSTDYSVVLLWRKRPKKISRTMGRLF